MIEEVTIIVVSIVSSWTFFLCVWIITTILLCIEIERRKRLEGENK